MISEAAAAEYSANARMPKYRCHKEVRALKITKVDLDWLPDGKTDARLHFEHGEGPALAFRVDSDYVRKHRPQVGGYYVVYEDGYKSWSPAEAFEAGYTLIE